MGVWFKFQSKSNWVEHPPCIRGANRVSISPMAKRQQQVLTARERECRRLSRERARRTVLARWKRRALIGGGGCVLALSLCAGIWEWRASGVSNVASTMQNGVLGMTAQGGFRVRETLLQGRARTPKAEVARVLSQVKNQPILAVPLEVLREQLEQLPTVKSASVERRLPGTLYVKLTERTPVAVWQNQGKLHLIDDEGVAMNDLNLADYPTLPLLVGAGAPAHVEEARVLLQAQPALSGRVEALVRVGDRRWDMRLHGGLVVKLPEIGASAAWAEFARLESQEGLTGRGAEVVDFRLPGRFSLRFPPALKTSSPSRET